MALESNRMLGGIGALLIVISSITSFLSLSRFFFPNLSIASLGSLFGVLGLVGIILFLIAMKGFAVHYKAPSIFNNALYWVITSIIEVVVAFALAFAVVLSVLNRIIGTITPFTPANPPTLSSVLEILRPLIGYFIPVGVVVFAFALVSVVFIIRAFNGLADKSGVRLFRTAGLLFLVGTVLAGALALVAVLLVLAALVSISAVLAITAVSGLVSLVAWILATVAFFRIGVPTSQTLPAPAPQTVTPAAGQVKYCPYCGAENLTDAAYCTRCGQKL